jgi:MFS family permease
VNAARLTSAGSHLAEITRLTYRYDRLRSIPQGVIETASSTFLLLIAVTAFDAGPTPKSLIAASGNIGFLLSLWLVPLVEQSHRPVMHVAARAMLVAAAAMLATAAIPTLPMLVFGSIVAIGAANAIIPLITSVYQDNYAPRERGRYVSRTLVIRIAATMVFAELAGRWLTQDIDLFRWVLMAFAAACVVAAIFLSRIPSLPLHRNSRALEEADQPQRLGIVFNAFGALRFLRTDRVLRWTLASWMLMGFANLMMWPLRVDYLANPAYGLALDPQQIALYTVLIPSLARLVLTPVWGRLFDRMNFFVMRIVLNVGFALGIAAFFIGSNTLGLVVGSLIFGASNAGGEIAWSLWVTKFAPEDRVAEYMSVHTFFTGVRGIAAPLLAFQLARVFSIEGIAALCATLIVLASLILVPEIKGQR